MGVPTRSFDWTTYELTTLQYGFVVIVPRKGFKPTLMLACALSGADSLYIGMETIFPPAHSANFVLALGDRIAVS